MAKHNRLNKITTMYNSTLWILGREIAALRNASLGGGKLSVSESKSLIDYIGILGKLKTAHEEIEAKKKAQSEASAKEATVAELEESVKDK